MDKLFQLKTLALFILRIFLLQYSLDLLGGNFQNLLHVFWFLQFYVFNSLVKELQELRVLDFHLHLLLGCAISVPENGYN